MRKITILPNHIYHIYNRGINRQNIFYQEDDYLLFISRIRDYFKNDHASLLCYCLMPNHYHLLIQVHCENFGNKVMMPFITSYMKVINHRENRVGTLFQGPYQALPIETDASLMQISRYIHLNPVKANLVDKAENWKYSSYSDYIGLVNSNSLNKKQIMDLFTDVNAYKKFVEENVD